jgi:transposase
LHLGKTAEISLISATSVVSGQDLDEQTAVTPIQAESKPAILRPGSAVQPSLCAAYGELIQSKYDQGLSIQRIYQDLRTESGFSGSYHSVRRFLQRLYPRAELPFRRMEVAAGEEVQVDFGQGAWIVGAEGKRSRPHLFRLVLSHSRKAYSEVVPRQTTEGFLHCLENAFHSFGGVPRTVVLDNLKAAVTRADWYDPELNPKIEAFARHYGTVFLPTKPVMPRHKGKVERGVDYAQENALRGRTFTSLGEQNAFLRHWEATVADTRIHGTTRRQVQQHFLQAERAALLPLPAERFANYREAQRKVHRDGHVEVERAYYSAPPEYLGRIVWARWDSRVVRLFNQRQELIATHVKHSPGRFSTLTAHLHSHKISKIESGAQALVNQARRMGDHTGQWAGAMLQERGLQGIRSLVGLLSLAKRYDLSALEEACRVAHQHQAYRLRSLRHLLGRQAVPESSFLDEHPLIRPLTDYGQIVRAASSASSPVLETV